MKILSIDTSTKYSVVSVSDGNNLLYGTRCLFEKGRCDGLFELIKYSLKRAGLALKDIDCFGVGVGPGSFTGLRIGVSAIKGLSYALSKPVAVFSSLDAIAWNYIEDKHGRLSVIVDAKRSNVYNRFYDLNAPSGPKILSEVSLTNIDIFLKDIKENDIFCGDGLIIYKDVIKKRFKKEKPEFAREELWYPTAQSICGLARYEAARADKHDCFSLGATYLYSHDCQVNKNTARMTDK